MSNYKSYGKLIKVHERTFEELKGIRDSMNKKSIDGAIIELIAEYAKSHSMEVPA